MGGLIKGVYSYVDPVGSLIEVTYSMNVDKTNYMEERKVMKNYVNSQATGRIFLISLCTLDPNDIDYFSNLSYMFLNPNNLFQFEFLLF